jgi:glycosyltransferase involved in cell wall biosynthesis
MKILLLSLYHPELVRGGSQQIAYELFEGLRDAGIDATLLSAVDSNAPALFKSGARITGFDGRPGEFVFLSPDYDYDWQKSSDPLRVEAFIEFLNLVQPDVVHFHHFLRFGIDFLTLTRRVLPQAKIILTCHEFLTICAAEGHMQRRTDGSLCSRPSAVRCHQCFPDQPPEHFFMRSLWMQRHLDNVDGFTAPSRFMIDMLAAAGLPREKCHHISNALQPRTPKRPESPRTMRNRFGFFGQMVDSKGILVLLQAAELLRADGFEDFTIEINGANLNFASPSRRAEIEAFLAAEAERPVGTRNVIVNGAYHPDQLASRMARIDWCVVPSTWWESFCLVISEAWTYGRPVIASDAGGPAERIREGVDGLLFPINEPRALADTMRRACTETGLWETLAGGITAPAGREVMVGEFMALYRK